MLWLLRRAEDPYRFTMEDMKWYLDWLFVRGVNMVFPHAFYYSLRDRRKEERPPEVGMHSSFWEDYHIASDYIKRMCGLLTDSRKPGEGRSIMPQRGAFLGNRKAPV